MPRAVINIQSVTLPRQYDIIEPAAGFPVSNPAIPPKDAVMDQLHKQVARARRRLIIEQFLGRLIWCLLGALSLAAIAIAAPRVTVIEGLPANWDFAWLIGGFAAAILS